MKPTAILTAALLCGLSPISFAKPLRVFILAGQSNMEGQGVVSMDGERDYNGGKGNLVWSMKNNVIFVVPYRMRQPFESAHVRSFLFRCGTTLRLELHGQIISSIALSLTPFTDRGFLC